MENGANACYHGGAFWDGIGANFQTLEKRHSIVPADVLDAWFAPAPEVISALREDLPYLIRTSAPTNCEGLIAAISRTRGVPESSLVVGAGSSDLIYRAFREWLTPSSRVLLLDPTYGEYAHVLEQVIGCRVERFRLCEADGYALNGDALLARIHKERYDLVILVNPNNPTGTFIARAALEGIVARIPEATRVWIDEAYIEYVHPKGPIETLEPLASRCLNVTVCKSLSKVYALSGLRAAYLVTRATAARELRRLTPPWVIGLPAQVAAVRALESPQYYVERYRETAALRRDLQAALQAVLPEGAVLRESPANWLLCHLPEASPTAASFVAACRLSGVYLRDTANQGMGARTLRIAVRSVLENARIVQALAEALPGVSPMI